MGRGVDSCQALVDALAGIHYTLVHSKWTFSWNSIDGETGFPRVVPYGFGPGFSARIDRHIDRELQRFIESAKRRLNKKGAPPRATRPSNRPLERAGINRRRHSNSGRAGR